MDTRFKFATANTPSRFARNARNEGFTLLECILALVTLSTILLLCTPVLRVLNKAEASIATKNQLEWHTFLIQAQNMLQETTFQKVTEQCLYVKEKQLEIKKKTRIEQYKTLIRRVKNGGHEVLLMDVKQLSFSKEEKGIYLEVVFRNDEKYTGFFFVEEEKE